MKFPSLEGLGVGKVSLLYAQEEALSALAFQITIVGKYLFEAITRRKTKGLAK